MVYWKHLIAWGLFFCTDAGRCSAPFCAVKPMRILREANESEHCRVTRTGSSGFRKSEEVNEQEVPIMRVKVTLACTECKRRNYVTKKNKRNNPERIEMNKHCKFCRKHTLHRETK